jgi:hypothetical protein
MSGGQESVFLERRTVSRKTPGDGRLEITKAAAARVERLGTTFGIDVSGETVAGTLGTFACTCGGPANPHVHYFLESERLKALSPGSALDVEIDEPAKRVRVRPAAPMARPDGPA